MQEQAGLLADFRTFFERAPGLYLVLAPDLTIVAVSDAYARAMMTTRAGLVGRALFDVLPDDPAAEAASALRQSLERVRALKRPDAVAAQKYAAPRPITAGGGFEERYWRALNAPVLDGNGELLWIIHQVEDVTELMSLRADLAERDALLESQQNMMEQLRAAQHALARHTDELTIRRNENEQRAAQRAAAEKTTAMSTLAGGLAQDFNSLLGVVIGNLDLLRQRAAGEAGEAGAPDLLAEAMAAALRGTELAQQLLAFAQRRKLQPALLDVNELVSELAGRLGRELGDGIEISLDLASELWPVMMDRAQLEGSLAGIVANAREAMSAGGRLIIGTRNVHLDADYVGEHPEMKAGDYAIIEVSDTGSGMPQEVVSRIFEPFFTTKEPGRGSGLGLSMAQGFLAQSGGHIEVASELGIGTTIRLYLPRLAAGAKKSEVISVASAAKGGRETVLVVEDDAAMRRIVRRQLYELGYQVLEAEHATTALRLLETERVDLLFTDIVTPGSIDGMALARTAAARWPALRILLTSGFPQTRLDEREQINGFRFLAKPYRRDDLARVLREMLGAAGSAPPMPPIAAERPRASQNG
ncbi:MAG TPA: ATP-binding protein [Stellaceae bacterium]|nr:ATP-binding protein [Stellaceae bacterium]